MRAYESFIIFDPSCSNEDVENEINKLTEIVTNEKGKIIEVNRWGKKKLSYEIKKKSLGIFIVFQFTLNPEKIKVFKEYFKFNNLVLRNSLVKVEIESEIPYNEYETEIEGEEL
ncbi:30S ribosomal protein S6 [candidate division WOR-3 bacterium]|nr:30S ribosomal protein S6 [candidate division WOR-3 bacterium]MCK4575060.1 30S ribosomal protein S6 [candidate division WOR-3 bacterium]